MLSDWYKKQKARKEAPRLLRWVLAMPAIGIGAILTARWALADLGGLLSPDQSNFMVATLVIIAVSTLVFAGYFAARLAQLARESRLSLTALMRSEED